MHIDLTQENWAFLSTQPAGRREMRYAMVVILVSAVVFLVAAPFATEPLVQVPAFIPMYVASLAVCDLITATLLFGQYRVLRTPALLVLAGGYLFNACITIAYALIFPGLFAPTGLLGAGPQTSSAMYMFWHGGFPLAVISYALIKGPGAQATVPSRQLRERARVAVLWTVAAVLLLVGGLTLVATVGHAWIPVFLEGHRTTPLGHTVLAGIWSLSLLALVVLWRRRPHTVLDLWLMVVMAVWLFDIALAAMLNTGRYDLGWYTGRIYGALAASALLVALLYEDGRQYARLVRLSIELSAANKALAQLSQHDGLTEIANRRYFDEYLTLQAGIAKRYRRPLALVLCDVDHFKTYNDHHGHQAGDACLKQVAAALQSCCQRPADKAARYGGEEFALILPDTELRGATRIAEAARAAVAALNLLHGKSPTGAHVHVSCGVAVLNPGLETSASQLIAAADRCLYQAKGAGRNRVVSAAAAPFAEVAV